MVITLIAAVSENGVIGRSGKLPWSLPSDLKRFKALTTDEAVVMGRKTWESLPPRYRPLPNRQNIVVTSNRDWVDPACQVAHSLPEALATSRAGTTFIIGGASLFEEGLRQADQVMLTRVLAEIEGDVFFPEFDKSDWFLAEVTTVKPDPKDEYLTRFEVYFRTRMTPSATR